MNKIVFGCLLLLTGLLSVSWLQQDEIVAALRAGSAERMAKHFDAMVDVTVPGKSNTYSKSQAELVLRDFFSQNRVRGFEIQHSGNNPSSTFLIGTLSTSNGNFRTTVYMRNRGSKLLVQGVELEAR
ncbi:MAG TPA: DUF4783 domain-containing protein [Lacibacter sp.]|nr:DUF4783 domain-containing protein [Lacibacter sp.]HMO88720.1 DUF4783 domain-containing protein [Lacibacter sp.]